MEENQTPTNETTFSEPESRPDVGFPIPSNNSSSGSNKWIFLLLLLVLLLVGGGIFLFTRNSGTGEATPEPTSEIGATTETPSPVPTATPTPVDKSKVKIEVQNGTGITGEAAYLQNQLRTLGYTSVTVGNSKTQNSTITTVTYKKDVATVVSDELTTKLQALYQDVTSQTSSTQTVDVLIVTGLRKGATPKPTASATPKPSASASASASPASSTTP